MDKIHNVSQLKSFHSDLQTLFDRQSSVVLIVESDNLTKRIIEPVLSKLGFGNVMKKEPNKEFLGELVNSPKNLVIWYELKPNDPVLDAMLKILPSIVEKKSIKLIFSSQPSEKATLTKVLNYNHKNIVLKPIEAKSIEEKILHFLT